MTTGEKMMILGNENHRAAMRVATLGQMAASIVQTYG
jgi:hypothetical protein